MMTPPSPSPLDRLSYLRWDKIGNCTRCCLHEGRTKIVYGEGNPTPDLLIVGEAPGANEDRQGSPFVGRAGQLLTLMLSKAGVTRDEVYITNILKCRPPRNRDPERDEITACLPFLHVQIWILQPPAIVTLGRFAGNLLTGNDLPMGRLTEQSWIYHHPTADLALPVHCLYHPAYLLRLGAKGELFEMLLSNGIMAFKEALAPF